MGKELENNALYLALNLRGFPKSFHWGITLVQYSPNAQYYHATNKSGGWVMENRRADNPMKSLSLVVLYRIGTVPPAKVADLDRVLRSVVADGTPSERTGEKFCCRIWIKDAIVKLNEAGVIQLTKSIDEIESEAQIEAELLEESVERGRSRAAIIDEL